MLVLQISFSIILGICNYCLNSKKAPFNAFSYSIVLSTSPFTSFPTYSFFVFFLGILVFSFTPTIYISLFGKYFLILFLCFFPPTTFSVLDLFSIDLFRFGFPSFPLFTFTAQFTSIFGVCSNKLTLSARNPLNNNDNLRLFYRDQHKLSSAFGLYLLFLEMD